jgi:hypothetical protein
MDENNDCMRYKISKDNKNIEHDDVIFGEKIIYNKWK